MDDKQTTAIPFFTGENLFFKANKRGFGLSDRLRGKYENRANLLISRNYVKSHIKNCADTNTRKSTLSH